MKGLARLRSSTRRFSADYWTFFAAAFCMDLGFGLFFFLFNLYLTDLHFDERVIGHIMASLTLGNVAGTIPGTILARRKGLRPLLLVTFICAPLFCMLRVLILWEPAQVALAFATGVVLCGWPICFSPTTAKLTNEDNRASGFSIAFATGIGLGTLAGVAGGYIPEWLRAGALHLTIVSGIRIVLLLACGITLLGIIPLRHLRLAHHSVPAGDRVRIFHPYLWHFLPAFILWNMVTGSFPMFGAVYLQKVLGISLGNIGAIFSGSQLAQFGAVLLAPLLFRTLGICKGIGAAQIGTAIFLVLIATTRVAQFAIGFYLLYFATQFMSGPGIYSLLMNSIPEEERSTASAIQNLSGALCQSGTAALTGICIVAFGYQSVLFANAAIAVLAALFFLLLGYQARASHIPATDTQAFHCDAELRVSQVVE